MGTMTRSTRIKRMAALAKINQRLRRWKTRLKRAQTMVSKLEASARRYDRLLNG